MLSETLAAPAGNDDALPARTISESCDTALRVIAAVGAARDELTAASVFNNAASSPALKAALREVARALLAHSRPNRRSAWVAEALKLAKITRDSGAYDLPAQPEDLLAARDGLAKGWTGVIACMLQVGAWEIRETPTLDAVPDWLWGDYTAWMFAAPPRFVPVQTDAVSAQMLNRVRDLERWVARNTGSSAIRAALTSYLNAEYFGATHESALLSRQLAEAHGRLFARVRAATRLDYDPPVSPRQGRRLRIGIVGCDFGPGPDLFHALPFFEHLDAKAFEVFLFPLRSSESAEAAYCSGRARGTKVLSGDATARVAVLRDARLDVIVFMGEVGRGDADVTELALHRMAPLQVVNQRSGVTTGLPEIDLYVSATEIRAERVAAAFTERLGLLRGAADAIAFARHESSAMPTGVSREALGLLRDCPLFAACVDIEAASDASLQAWAQSLARSDGAHLAIAFANNGADAHLTRFCSAIDRVFDAHGIVRGRVHVFPTSPKNPAELRGLVALTDVYLDGSAGRLATWVAAEALQLGVPVIAAGNEAGAPAGMLRSLGLANLVTTDSAAYATLASDLILNPERRAALRTQINSAMEAVPEFMDSLAASDAFGALLEAAFDELSSLGRVEFRRQLEPVRCFGVENPAETIESGLAAHARGDLEIAAMESSLALRSTPANPAARHLQGVVLHAQGNIARAVEYLLAAVQPAGATAAMWYSLALALRDNGQVGEATQALETCIRLDHRHVEALWTILELAERVGASDLARDVLESLRLIAPEDPRVLAMS